MSDNVSITREQLRTLYVATELGGGSSDSNRFSYAALGKSSYSFGQLQYDVGKNHDASDFLEQNGFDAIDIKYLKSHGSLPREILDVLDAKLQAIPQAKLSQFTNSQLDKTAVDVGDVIHAVRKQNQDAAETIDSDQKLQLGIADYINQFGLPGHQFVGFLAGKTETLHSTGITVQAGNPPTREDIQAFINATDYGHRPENARGVASREARFNMAMAELGLGPAVEVASHAAAKAREVLRHGDRGPAVHDLQARLAELGYTDNQGHPLQVDGDFGPTTQAAVERFQSEHHLAADGKVGPATWQAVHADVQMLRRDDPGLLPSVAAMSSLPADTHGLDDPRHAFNPNHALFNDLKHRLPDASDNRLLQFTAACHAHGITDRNLSDIRFDQQNGIVSFAGRAAGEPFHGISVDVKVPSPPAQQSIQQIHQFDQYQTQLQATIQAQITQNNGKRPPKPPTRVRGGQVAGR